MCSPTGAKSQWLGKPIVRFEHSIITITVVRSLCKQLLVICDYCLRHHTTHCQLLSLVSRTWIRYGNVERKRLASAFDQNTAAGWAFHIRWLKCSLCLDVCLDVNQGGTNRNQYTERLVGPNLACTDLMNPDRTTKNLTLTYFTGFRSSWKILICVSLQISDLNFTVTKFAFDQTTPVFAICSCKLSYSIRMHRIFFKLCNNLNHLRHQITRYYLLVRIVWITGVAWVCSKIWGRDQRVRVGISQVRLSNFFIFHIMSIISKYSKR